MFLRKYFWPRAQIVPSTSFRFTLFHIKSHLWEIVKLTIFSHIKYYLDKLSFKYRCSENVLVILNFTVVRIDCVYEKSVPTLYKLLHIRDSFKIAILITKQQVTFITTILAVIILCSALNLRSLCWISQHFL